MKDHVIAGHKVKDKRSNEADDDDGTDKNDDDDDNDIQCEQDIPLIKL